MSERAWPSTVGAVVLAVVLCCSFVGAAGVSLVAPVAGAPGAAAGSAVADERITNVTLSGDGTFRHNGTQTIWRSSAANLTVAVETGTEQNGQLQVCAAVDGNGTPTCDTVRIKNGTGTLRTVLAPQQNVAPGRHRLQVNLSTSLTVRDRVTLPVFIAEKSGDLDLDRLSNVRERKHGLNMTNPDVDDDGLVDGDEVDRYGTDPRDPDSDDDGALDGVEISGPSNATNPDTDDDGLKDGLELDLGLDPTDPDSDGDGLSDGTEYDGSTAPGDADTDGDGLDDGEEVDRATSATDPDTDGDGLQDGREVELGLDPTDPDSDGDLLNDGLEVTLGTSAGNALATVVKLLAVAALVGAVAIVGRRRVDWDRFGDAPAPDGGGPPSPSAAAESTADDEADAEPTPDPELLPPDQRLEHMLEAADGRMRQAEIVEATDWSKAKVSRTLSDMEEDGVVSRFRLGRENVVTLGDHDAGDELDSEVGD